MGEPFQSMQIWRDRKYNYLFWLRLYSLLLQISLMNSNSRVEQQLLSIASRSRHQCNVFQRHSNVFQRNSNQGITQSQQQQQHPQMCKRHILKMVLSSFEEEKILLEMHHFVLLLLLATGREFAKGGGSSNRS